MGTRWSFNRNRDSDKIIHETLVWKGPYCLPGLEKETNLKSIPDITGVYLFCFPYLESFVLESAGITKSTKNRIATHLREFRRGNYNIFDIEELKKCERVEIWHGWADGKKNREEFENNKAFYSEAIEKQLLSYRIFLSEVPELRKRERIEAAIMINTYVSKEPWADFAPRWMLLRGRFNHELPIQLTNYCETEIFGLPNQIEI